MTGAWLKYEWEAYGEWYWQKKTKVFWEKRVSSIKRDKQILLYKTSTAEKLGLIFGRIVISKENKELRPSTSSLLKLYLGL